jgi:hypothetical protein
MLLLLVGYGGSEVDDNDDNDEDDDSDEVEARSVAWKLIWIMVASMERVVSVAVDVVSVERSVYGPDKVTIVGRVNCVVADAGAPSVPFTQVIRGCVVEAIIC